MEGKKLNLKEFDLEAAKAGRPVRTRDGRRARIICHDRQSGHGFPVVALVEHPGAERDEDVHFYRADGTAATAERAHDLMMSPEKREGWAVIYKDDLLRTEKEAQELAGNSISEVIRIEKIEWEE